MIAIVDSGIANIGSVLRAMRRVDAKCSIADQARDIDRASALILPGVGAFAGAMAGLRKRQMDMAVRSAARNGIPILGICLGMQLLALTSEEFGLHEGLGLFPGNVVRLVPDHPGQRVPNIGWCDVTLPRCSRLFSGVASGSAFYFMHSYVLECDDARDITGTLVFGQNSVCVAFERENLFGAQFHPEKSQDAGLRVLHNFAGVARCKR